MAENLINEIRTESKESYVTEILAVILVLLSNIRTGKELMSFAGG
jgi:hypothetical protein